MGVPVTREQRLEQFIIDAANDLDSLASRLAPSDALRDVLHDIAQQGRDVVYGNGGQ